MTDVDLILPVTRRSTADSTMVRIGQLRADGVLVRRDGEFEFRHPEIARPFVARIEAMARALRRTGAANDSRASEED